MECVHSSLALDVSRLARAQVRARTRTLEYHEYADRFTESAIGVPLGVPRGRSFSAGLREYLAAFSETAAYAYATPGVG